MDSSLSTSTRLSRPPAYNEIQECRGKIEETADNALRCCRESLGAFSTLPNQIKVLERMIHKLNEENPGIQRQLQITTDGAVAEAGANQAEETGKINLSDKTYLTAQNQIKPIHKQRFMDNKISIRDVMLDDPELFLIILTTCKCMAPLLFSTDMVLQNCKSDYMEQQPRSRLRSFTCDNLLNLFNQRHKELSGLLVFLEERGVLDKPSNNLVNETCQIQ